MSIDINGIEAFVRVAELGSFRRAADALFLSPPALSHRISKLEQTLGLRLLDRTSRTVKVTSVGREFATQGRRLIYELERSIGSLRDAAKHDTGQVILACIPTAAAYMLPSVMKAYTAKFPRNRIRILDFSARETLEAVRSGEAEFGITLGGASDKEIESEDLFKDPFVVVCRREHALARQRSVAWCELEKHQVINVGRLGGSYVYPDRVLSLSPQAHGLYEVQQPSTTGLGLAEAGMGVIVLPRLAFIRTKHPQLIAKALVSPAVTRDVCIIRRRRAAVSPATQQFLRLLKDRWTKKHV